MGAIFAGSKRGVRAYQRWRGNVDRESGRSSSLAGVALESAVLALASTNPEYVVFGPG